MKKEEYQKPTMMIVELQQSYLLAGSEQNETGSANGEGFTWDEDE